MTDERKTRAAEARAIDTLARTLYGEARGEGLPGIEAVAAIVLNRVAIAEKHGGYWWGDDIVGVCRKPYQFSCWNENDPNRARIESVAPGDKMFDICLRVARRAVRGLLDDPTGGATHYHTKAILPRWARAQAPVAEIGEHLFYRLED